MKAVFLIIDYVPHQILTIKNLISNYDAEVFSYHVGRFDKTIPVMPHFTTTQYDSISKQDVLENIISINPDIVVVAGWMIPEYIWVAKQLKKQLNVPIVSYSDTQWYGTFRQKINTYLSPYHVKKAFTHIWVAGIYQFEYARRLGFKKENILFNSLSADTELFKTIDIDKKVPNYPKNFLYIGRFIEEKGLQFLVEAWQNIKDKKDWSLTLIGDGYLKQKFIDDKSIKILPYMNQNLLVQEMQNSGCFMLPSIYEPWALVLHEAAAAGLPIICTNICGASPHFVYNNFNGFVVDPSSSEQLITAMEKIMQLDTDDIIQYSKRSRELGLSITPEISILSLMNSISK